MREPLRGKVDLRPVMTLDPYEINDRVDNQSRTLGPLECSNQITPVTWIKFRHLTFDALVKQAFCVEF
jgi:hypothetical protein